MAKIRMGVAVSAISGSVAGTTFSRNRGGAYMRNRSKPTVSTTTAAQNAKARLALFSQSWQGLTEAQRTSWKRWAGQNPVTDVLGDQRVLSGHQAYIGLNTRLHLIGQSAISAPPIVAPPDGLLTVSVAVDIGTGDTEVTYTTTPLGAGDALFLSGTLQDSAGVSYVKNQLRFFHVSSAAAASPEDIETDLTSVFGTPVEDQTFHLSAAVIDTATGLLSTPLFAKTVVVDSP